jgi:hypothetical protein
VASGLGLCGGALVLSQAGRALAGRRASGLGVDALVWRGLMGAAGGRGTRLGSKAVAGTGMLSAAHMLTGMGAVPGL